MTNETGCACKNCGPNCGCASVEPKEGRCCCGDACTCTDCKCDPSCGCRDAK